MLTPYTSPLKFLSTHLSSANHDFYDTVQIFNLGYVPILIDLTLRVLKVPPLHDITKIVIIYILLYKIYVYI